MDSRVFLTLVDYIEHNDTLIKWFKYIMHNDKLFIREKDKNIQKNYPNNRYKYGQDYISWNTLDDIYRNIICLLLLDKTIIQFKKLFETKTFIVFAEYIISDDDIDVTIREPSNIIDRIRKYIWEQYDKKVIEIMNRKNIAFDIIEDAVIIVKNKEHASTDILTYTQNITTRFNNVITRLRDKFKTDKFEITKEELTTQIYNLDGWSEQEKVNEYVVFLLLLEYNMDYIKQLFELSNTTWNLLGYQWQNRIKSYYTFNNKYHKYIMKHMNSYNFI